MSAHREIGPGVSARSVGRGGSHPVLTLPVVLCGAVVFAIVALDLGAEGFALGLLIAVVPVPFYVMAALWLDRFEAEPVRVLAWAFAWGATVAALISMTVTGYAVEAAYGLGGVRAAAVVADLVTAPVVEELSKGFALLVIYRELEDEFDGVVDGIVYAAMVGLGFAMVENVEYYGQALASGAERSLSVFVVRGMMAPFAHPFFTAMMGIGLGLVRERPDHPRRRVLPLLGLAAAVGMHALWNLAASFERWFVLAYLLVMVPAFLGLILLGWLSLRREAAILREHLCPLVDDGVLADAELERLCGVRHRLRSSLEALWRGGRSDWMDRMELHQVASELAFHRWRVARGISRGEELDRRREEAFVRRLRELCGEEE